ncbi:hypothetical protein [Gottfriedia solisilvae]
MKKIYIVRHCEATGQPPESSLTQKGLEQSQELSHFFRIYLLIVLFPVLF